MTKKKMYVPHLWRRDDGVRFSRNPDGTYSMDTSMMHRKYRYTLEFLLEKTNNAFTIIAPKSNGQKK